MKNFLILCFIIFATFPANAKPEQEKNKMTVYDFSFETLDKGENFPLSNLKGKVALIVNTASHCGFTGQYKALETLYKTYKDKGFVVIGVPSADFGGQEFATDAEVKQFCEKNFGVTFPMMSIETVSGKNAHPFYQFASQQLGFGSAPKWNFHKYLISKNGEVVDYFGSMTTPDSKKITSAIEKLLNE